jgi:hypothetical protein
LAGPKADLDDVKRDILPLSRIELQPFIPGRPTDVSKNTSVRNRYNCCSFLVSLCGSEDGGDMFLRNLRRLPGVYKAIHVSRP